MNLGQKVLIGCATAVLVPYLILNAKRDLSQAAPPTAKPATISSPSDERLPQLIEVRAIKRLRDSLRDPDSMVTRAIRVPSGKPYLCGEVNSRNGLGAKSGFKRFISGATDALPPMIEEEGLNSKTFNDLWIKAC